jgi:hypothetical protein
MYGKLVTKFPGGEKKEVNSRRSFIDNHAALWDICFDGVCEVFGTKK